MSATGEEIACIELVELVTEYVEGRLDPPRVERFEAHIAICEGCRTYLDQMRETIDALGHLPEESLSDEAREQLLVAFAGWKRDQA
jgi:anti-sigma factor RsiW